MLIFISFQICSHIHSCLVLGLKTNHSQSFIASCKYCFFHNIDCNSKTNDFIHVSKPIVTVSSFVRWALSLINHLRPLSHREARWLSALLGKNGDAFRKDQYWSSHSMILVLISTVTFFCCFVLKFRFSWTFKV